jgi:hypothetical protein
MRHVTFENPLYPDLATNFLRDYLKSVISALDSEGVIDLSRPLSDRQLDLIFTVVFYTIAHLEDFGGQIADGRRHMAALMFARLPAGVPVGTPPSQAEYFLASDLRTLMHGQITDGLMRDIAEDVRQMRQEPQVPAFGSA